LTGQYFTKPEAAVSGLSCRMRLGKTV